MATVRPPKRQRMAHRLPPMIDGSDQAMDTAMYIHSEGGERVLVPIRPNDLDPDIASTETKPEPDYMRNFAPDDQHPVDVEMNVDHHEIPRKTQCFYMKEFVT